MSSTPVHPAWTIKAEVTCLLDMLGVAVPCAEPRGLMGRISQQKSHLCRVETRRAPGGCGRAEKWRDTVCAPVTLCFKLLSAQGHCEPRSNVVAERHRAQEVCPADAKPLPSRKGGRHYRTPWM